MAFFSSRSTKSRASKRENTNLGDFFLANISVNEARFSRRNYQPTAFLLRNIFRSVNNRASEEETTNLRFFDFKLFYGLAIVKTRRVEVPPGRRGLFPSGVGSHALFVLLVFVVIAAIIWYRTMNPYSIPSANIVTISPDALCTAWANMITHIAAV